MTGARLAADNTFSIRKGAMTHNLTTPFLSADTLFSDILSGNEAKTEHLRLLCRLAQLGLQHLQQQEAEPCVSFREAAEARLDAAQHRRAATRSDLRSYIQRFLRYAPFTEKSLREVRRTECQALLDEHFSVTPSVKHKAKIILQSIFSLGVRRGWCIRNPAADLLVPPVENLVLIPLHPAQIRALMRACTDEKLRPMEAAVRLMLWCGIRPTEVQRLRWCDIDRSEKCVYVEPRNSKTGGARAVPLRGGALALLKEKHHAEERIAPRDWQRLWRHLRDRAGLHPWRQDTLRHTFASMHQKYFHNIVLLQEEMGHRDCNLLRCRYLNLRDIKTETARLFFESRWEAEATKRIRRR